MRKKLILSFVIFTNLFHFTLIAQPVLTITSKISGLNSPVQVVNAGDGSKRIFIVEKGGGIKVYSESFSSLGTFVTVTGLNSGSEEGLLSLAFHPAYATNGLFFVYYVNSGGNLEIARYKVSAGNANVADVSSKVVVLTINHPSQSNHNGGELHFGPDGMLYLSTGDGGGGGDTNNNAQNTSVLLGKLLRLQVNESLTPPYYTIPTGNPYGNEVYAYGLRNPFRWSFDRINDDVYIGDVGQDAYEEFDRRSFDSLAASNFGWRCYEGNSTFNMSVGCGGSLSDYVFPIYDYATQNPAASAIGGMVYRGYKYEALKGYYLSADYYSGKFYLHSYNAGTNTWTTTIQVISPTGMADFGENEAGEMFVLCRGNNTLYAIESNGAVNTTYIFTGNGNWDLASNWANGMVPPALLPAGHYIVVKPANGGVCKLTQMQTVAAGGFFIVEPGSELVINNNLQLLH